MSCATLDIQAYDATRKAVAADPEKGKGDFETVTEWQDGAQAVTRARSFTLQTDEPTPLGGKDEHIDPMELLLASLGTCLTIGWITQARKRGIEYRNLKIRVKAPFDLRGYLALDGTIRPGFTSIDYAVEVESNVNPSVLEEIRVQAERTSPMFDNILNATAIKGRVASKIAA